MLCESPFLKGVCENPCSVNVCFFTAAVLQQCQKSEGQFSHLPVSECSSADSLVLQSAVFLKEVVKPLPGSLLHAVVGFGGGCCSGRRGCSRSVCVFQGQPMDQAAMFTPQVRPPAQLPQYPGLQQAQVLCCSGGVSA